MVKRGPDRIGSSELCARHGLFDLSKMLAVGGRVGEWGGGQAGGGQC